MPCFIYLPDSIWHHWDLHLTQYNLNAERREKYNTDENKREEWKEMKTRCSENVLI